MREEYHLLNNSGLPRSHRFGTAQGDSANETSCLLDAFEYLRNDGGEIVDCSVDVGEGRVSMLQLSQLLRHSPLL